MRAFGRWLTLPRIARRYSLDGPTRRHRTPESRQAPRPRPDWESEPAPALSQRLLAILKTALPRGAMVLVVLTATYYAMGVLKTKVLAHTFGQGPDTDAFHAAFTVPSLALEFLLMGGLIACFVPVYVGLRDEFV